MCTPRWYITYATYVQKFKKQLMVTSVDDNVKYLKNCGAKHHIEMSIEIMYYTQGLQFRCREDGYLQRWITRIKDQPLKWRGILDDELPSVKRNSNSYKVRRLYLETTDSNCENKHQALQRRATGVDDAVQWGLRYSNPHKWKFLEKWESKV